MSDAGRRPKGPKGRPAGRVCNPLGASRTPDDGSASPSHSLLPSGLETRSRWVIISETWYYLALALISAAALGYEVLLVRLFAIVQWHHLAFMAISIALLGFGASGTFLAMWREWVRPRFESVFAVGAGLFAISAPVGFILAQRLPLNPLTVVWDPAQLLYLPAMYLLLFIPFFGAATCVGAAFVCRGDHIGPIYASNLIGSGVGALVTIAALFVLSPSDALRLVAVLGFLSAALITLKRDLPSWPLPSLGSFVLAILVWTALPDPWVALRISEYKGLPSTLRIAGTQVVGERSSPLGLLTVVDSPEVPFRYVPGLSLNAPTPPSGQLGVFIDGGSMTAITRFDGRREELAYLDHTTDALAYHLTGRPAVLVLGSGGGRSVLQALYHRARRIDAVDLDPNMVRLVGEDHAGDAGRIYSRPEVWVHVAEARSFVTSSERKWDIVQIPLLDSFGTAAAGVHGLTETYVYTVEAFAHYLRRLNPEGWLSVTRWLKLPPRDTLRLFATALDALARLDVEAPARRLILLRGINTTTLLVKNGVVTGDDIVTAKAFADGRAFDLGYFPGITAEDTNRFNVLDEPYFFAGANALVGKERDRFLEAYKFDIAPTTDQRPYFFDFLKWRTLPELLEISKAGGASLLELGNVILVATLVQAAVLSTLLVLAPLWAGRRASLQSRPLWRVGSYFFALGLAFLFVEIAFIQKFILFLGHPLYSVAVVLAAFLVFAGIGSALSSRLERRMAPGSGGGSRLSALPLSVAGIVALSIGYIPVLPGMFDALVHVSEIAKILISLALIAPLGFCMGMPFPLGLSRVRRQAPSLVPWSWGVNGCASVLSAVLATLISTTFGFSTLLFAAAVLYAAAPAILGRSLDRSHTGV